MTADWKARAEAAEKERDELRARLIARTGHGHNDTCQKMLSPEYPCNCGQDAALEWLDEKPTPVCTCNPPRPDCCTCGGTPEDQ